MVGTDNFFVFLSKEGDLLNTHSVSGTLLTVGPIATCLQHSSDEIHFLKILFPPLTDKETGMPRTSLFIVEG